MKYDTFTLDNGLRIIHLDSSSPVVYCGYGINAGTRDERPGEEGLAHFCEHVTFKGTTHRKAWHILNCLESVGGDLNAFTNKEDTVYYAAILQEHTDRAVDLLTDIVFHSVYPQNEIDKEVEVICDEIESYNDSPSELIYDEFENAIFSGHELGHNILGTNEKVKSFTTEDALRFTRKYYRPENSIFFIYGHVDFKRLVNKGTHQAHVMIGNRAYDVFDDKRIGLYLLNNILGGPGMNAKLNLSLREHHGLVYTVESNMVSYGDTGLWCTYFGCDPEDVNKCRRLVRNVLDKFMSSPMTESQLRAARKQIKGQIGVARDSRENFALEFGKSFLHYGWEKDISALYKHIDEVTPELIQQVAQEIFAEDRITTLIYK